MTWLQINAFDPVTASYKLLWTTPPPGQANMANSLPVTIASDQLIQPQFAAPAAEAFGTPINFTNYGTVRVQVDGLSGGDTITVTGSSTQAGTYYPMDIIVNAGTGAQSTTITASGLYQILFAGGWWLTFTHNGSSSSPILTVSASQ